jgi:hypothetical protein
MDINCHQALSWANDWLGQSQSGRLSQNRIHLCRFDRISERNEADTMADRVRFVMDRMAPLFKQLEQSGIFSVVSVFASKVD